MSENAQIGALTADVVALLRNGATVKTPEVRRKIADLHHPAHSCLPLAVVDAELHEHDVRFQSAAMIGQVDEVYRASGADAATRMVRDWSNQTAMPDDDRDRIMQEGLERVRTLASPNPRFA
jgi:hypothetical protein